ncbi:divergent polysaccharide deacetylase family protein [Desulfobacula sp.]|uniref:divergent polysaccharide deacetylase family protein n=1 Tax=Desulfobacula sp. TaxID=2593537 RepID=UPI00261E9FD4|nr:divergent polysaccharide deacetylase family protein [Desulfobacula sp.]
MAAKKKGAPPKKGVPKKKSAPQKKAVSKKSTSPRKSPKPIIFTELKKILVGIGILLSLCLTVAMIADIFLQPGRLEKKKPMVIRRPAKPEIKPIQEGLSEVTSKRMVTGLKKKSGKPITYEVFEDIDHTTIPKPMPPSMDHTPKIAIIIDDIGYDKKIAWALGDLNSNITFSVLPFAPFGRVISERLNAMGFQLMLHLPMEPMEYPQVNPGPGAILSEMSPDLLLDQLRKDIKEVPYVVGVNNHMGSRLTSHSDQMNQIFTILKKKHLFFIDSRTSSESQCEASARLFKLKFAQRDVFLDNLQETAYITGQLKTLINLAKKHGSAIGIGHPYEATLKTLSRELPKLKNTVEIVRASDLTTIPG